MRALDLANYIINRSIEAGRPISNLQLQKILYFVNLLYLHDTRRFLIDEGEDFQAWMHGPVIPSVYRIFAINGGIKIYDLQPRVDTRLATDADGVNIIHNLDNINNSIDYLATIDAWDLVEYSHSETGAWSNTYRSGERVIINRNDIRREAGV